MNLTPKDLEHLLNIEVANKESIPVDRVHKNSCVEIRGHKTLAGRISIQLGEFDVILGMDWLDNYEAMIDCHRKTVNLTTEVVSYGNCNLRQSSCISMMQTKRLFKKGCVGYLAYIVSGYPTEGIKLE